MREKNLEKCINTLNSPQRQDKGDIYAGYFLPMQRAFSYIYFLRLIYMPILFLHVTSAFPHIYALCNEIFARYFLCIERINTSYRSRKVY